MDELVDRSDSGMVSDKFDHDMRGWFPSSAGEKGLVAMERLMGMVLVALSVKMLLDRFSDYLRDLLAV